MVSKNDNFNVIAIIITIIPMIVIANNWSLLLSSYYNITIKLLLLLSSLYCYYYHHSHHYHSWCCYAMNVRHFSSSFTKSNLLRTVKQTHTHTHTHTHTLAKAYHYHAVSVCLWNVLPLSSGMFFEQMLILIWVQHASHPASSRSVSTLSITIISNQCVTIDASHMHMSDLKRHEWCLRPRFWTKLKLHWSLDNPG